ncbi:MAG: N-carbamoyl-L-amino acid amidohydrolase [Pseudoalteromonas sp.]
MSKSPYLKDQRLADVIAAIQVMSTYKFYKLDFSGWTQKITGTKEDPEYWKSLFEDHPEFFRLNNNKQKASLVWRRSHQRNYHVDKEQVLEKSKIDKLPDDEKSERISRAPLNNSDIATLISTAIDLHTRAIESEKEKRWLVPSLVSILVVTLATFIKSFT